MVQQLAAGVRRHESGQQRDPLWLGKADSSIAGGNEGTVSLWDGDPGSEEDTGRNKEECYNRSTVTIAAGDFCLVREIRGRRYAIPFPGSSTTQARLIARIADSETELLPYSYASDSAPYDLIGRARSSSGGYGNNEGDLANRPALPTCAGEVYEMQDVGSGVYKYVSLGACTLINPTPWKYYAENHDADSGEPTDEDLLLVSKHGSGSVYTVDRPLSWTPHAVFRATTVSGGFIEWDVINGSSASHYPYTNNQMFGEIAEPDDSSFTGGIKILAPGVRVYEVSCQINVWFSGITASTVTIQSALPAGYMNSVPYSNTISTGNFTTTRLTYHLHGLMHLKRGDKTIYTTLSVTPSVSVTLEAMMLIRPWTL